MCRCFSSTFSGARISEGVVRRNFSSRHPIRSNSIRQSHRGKNTRISPSLLTFAREHGECGDNRAGMAWQFLARRGFLPSNSFCDTVACRCMATRDVNSMRIWFCLSSETDCSRVVHMDSTVQSEIKHMSDLSHISGI
jgi:hypothetical protein